MRIGVAKEIKQDEYRVALMPAGAVELVRLSHEVLVEEGADKLAYEAVAEAHDLDYSPLEDVLPAVAAL